MTVYYCEVLDIMCIVRGNRIWKYVGDFAPEYIKCAALRTNDWYSAKNHPTVDKQLFIKIGGYNK